ncbi:hypothetical protein, partial [Frankia sp. CiP3]|uniref:hypothetical protein n=1 Tax=Frankia sp. CiP3 TaxID=2880971 RepID=UPI001EF47862
MSRPLTEFSGASTVVIILFLADELEIRDGPVVAITLIPPCDYIHSFQESGFFVERISFVFGIKTGQYSVGDSNRCATGRVRTRVVAAFR